LDTRKAEGAELKLTIALSLQDESTQMDEVVIQFQQMLREFPAIAGNTFIMSADQFEQRYAGAEFYVRSRWLKSLARFFFFAAWLFVAANANAGLAVTVSLPKVTGSKAVVPLALKNNFAEKIESARAAVFLLDDQGKMIGHSTKWVIGGSDNKPGLAAGATNAFHFVITSDKPFTTTNLTTKVSSSTRRASEPLGKLGAPGWK
jgi:hypothetical protein